MSALRKNIGHMEAWRLCLCLPGEVESETGCSLGGWSTPTFRFRHPETLGLEADRPNLFTHHIVAADQARDWGLGAEWGAR